MYISAAYSPPTMDRSIQYKPNEVREVLWVESVARHFAHVSADGQRDLLNLRVTPGAAGRQADNYHHINTGLRCNYEVRFFPLCILP